MCVRGDFLLSCSLELSGADFPFSINQDPGYPETGGSQAESVGHAFVSLPEGGGELRAELCKAHLLREKLQPL